MTDKTSRRTFFKRAAGVAAAVTLPPSLAPRLAFGEEPAVKPGKSRVVIARDEALTKGELADHAELMRKLLDAAMQKLSDAPDAATAWRRLFKPTDRVGLKVNTLGRFTQPAAVDAIVAGLRQADVPAENIIIWDRFDGELAKAGFKLNKSASGVRCYGTNVDRQGNGYQEQIEKSGSVATCFSRILAEQIDVVVSVPVFKDHGIAGSSLGMKNFYGAFHNPNKYHDNHCDPYIAEVVAHRFIAPRWRLTIGDGTRGQYQGGPSLNPAFTWTFGGFLVSTDFVAADAVGTDLLDEHRKSQGLKPVADDGRPATYLATAAKMGLGQADLSRIERLEV